MCGRYAFFKLGDLAQRFGIENTLVGFEPTVNASPGMFLPVILKQSPTRVELKKWGLAPEWAEKHNYKLINLRAETLAYKPYFRQLLLNQRAIVPANGYFEWHQETHRPYYFTLPEAVMGLAGIWEGDTFAIITTKASGEAKQVHGRMPVILQREAEGVWLDKKVKDAKLLKRCFDSVESVELKIKAINKIDEKELING